jgi:hypothetical protein
VGTPETIKRLMPFAHRRSLIFRRANDPGNGWLPETSSPACGDRQSLTPGQNFTWRVNYELENAHSICDITPCIYKLEPVVGFEPTTDGLQNRCSTTELNWLRLVHSAWRKLHDLDATRATTE